MDVEKKLYFADLFAGIGGFHYALDLVSKKMNFKIQCKYVSEIDEQAKKNYCMNFDFPIENIFDINKFDNFINTSKLDIVFCGFPCQPFSNAGLKKGFKDEERGKLIFKVKQFVKKTQPKIILLENVKYLTNHNNQETYGKIIKLFKKEGYIGTSINNPLIISPHQFNLKQRRERVFIPLVKKDLFNKTTSNNKYYVHNNINNEIIPTIDIENFPKIISTKKFAFDNPKNPIKPCQEIENALTVWEEFITHFQKQKKSIPIIYIDEMICNKIDEIKYKKFCWYKKYVDKMKLFYSENKDFIDEWFKKNNINNWKNKKIKKIEWQAGNISFKKTYLQIRQSGLRFKKNNLFPTLVATVQTPLIYTKKNGWRYLTKNEVRKLQNFPKNHKIDENNFQAFKQFGNAVNVYVTAYVIYSYLKPFIEEVLSNE